MIITDNTPLAMMTVGQLKEVIRETKAAEEQQPARTHKYVYGLEGIRQLFGVGLNTAQKYVHIMTPYLILGHELEDALRFAARRGVDVSIILPGIPDKRLPFALAKSHYRTLIEAGVKIYEYTPGFVHAKVFVSDGCKATVGTINLDYRSLYHHFECAVYCYESDCIKDIEKDFQETLEKSRKITKKTIWKGRPLLKPLSFVLKIIAPLL